MPIFEIAVVPLGTATPSLGDHVRAVYEVLERSGLPHRLTPMGSCIEGEWEAVLPVLREMHETCFRRGALRVSTSIKVDDRRDRPLTLQGKLDRVLGPSRR